MASRVSHTTLDCHDAFALSTWWKQVLNYSDVVGDPNELGDEECVIVDDAGGHLLLFIEVDDDKRLKNRMHLDLVPTDRRRDAEVDRVLALGASQITDLRRPDGSGWVTLADPEGNEFCILRSDEERVTTAASSHSPLLEPPHD
jgi:Glyoxalase-like domain